MMIALTTVTTLNSIMGTGRNHLDVSVKHPMREGEACEYLARDVDLSLLTPWRSFEQLVRSIRRVHPPMRRAAE
jgi:hypothetical protein